MPKEILERVDAKQDTVVATDMPMKMIGRFGGGMSTMRFPKPRAAPTWVRVASARRKTCWVGQYCLYCRGDIYGGRWLKVMRE